MHTFYEKEVKSGVNFLSEEEARHALTVLRLRSGDTIRIVDGLGTTYTAVLTDVTKKQCYFKVTEALSIAEKPFTIHLAIAPTKNIDRMEWLVEKLGEIGVDRLSFIITERSERTKLRIDRLEKKAISAMKQSGNARLMHIVDGQPLQNFLEQTNEKLKLIAQVSEDHTYISQALPSRQSCVILIGPEGDFSDEEVAAAARHGFTPISLGKNVLRTETAGLIACQFVNTANNW